MNPPIIASKIIKFIKKNTPPGGVILGLSGGIDSAVVAYLAVVALGKKKVFGVLAPSVSNSSADLRLGKMVADVLGIKYKILSIEPIVKSFKKASGIFENKKSLGNLKARTRMALLYGEANERSAMVLGTGNKTEIMSGYFTKHGDGGVDLLPLGDLYKTEVRALAKYLGVPQEIIDRPPTAGLWSGQTDEGEMGITYDELDKILEARAKRKSLRGFSVSLVKKVERFVKNSAHKRALPPICKI